MELTEIANYILSRQIVKQREMEEQSEISKREIYALSSLIATQVSKIFAKNARLLKYEDIFKVTEENSISSEDLLLQRKRRSIERRNNGQS